MPATKSSTEEQLLLLFRELTNAVEGINEQLHEIDVSLCALINAVDDHKQ